MAGDGEEQKRAMGLPLGGLRNDSPEEQQRVMGLPQSWFQRPDIDLSPLAHPVQACRRWSRRRRLGIYANDDDS